jgi:hypothetical protein
VRTPALTGGGVNRATARAQGEFGFTVGGTIVRSHDWAPGGGATVEKASDAGVNWPVIPTTVHDMFVTASKGREQRVQDRHQGSPHRATLPSSTPSGSNE